MSRGGNLLLDIGPTADGRIPVVMEERLIQIGDWLKVNGEAIYGTRHAGRECQWTDGRAAQAGIQGIQGGIQPDGPGRPGAEGGKAVKQVFFTKKPDALYAITRRLAGIASW